MIRPVRADGSIETGGVFVPITRRRVIDRIASAALQRVVLIVAPAGYGKSVALRQYLDSTDAPHVRFDVLPDHAGLLGFLRGLSDAVGEIAPDARVTLPGAYEKNAASQSAGSDLALWMYSHLKSYRGIIAIDDLHIAQEDREVTRFLASLIDRSKGRIQWILASRSTLGLPIGTWLAYGDSDLAIDEHDLKFSAEEAREAARAFRLAVRDDELYELLNLTDGWATAMSFALRSSTRSVDLRNVSSMTREMIYRYLAEQVYETLSDEEQRFIETAALLPRVDLDVLLRAGFDRANALLETLRQRVAFIYEAEPGHYRLHDLFREFLRKQLELRGETAARTFIGAVGGALLALDRKPEALRFFVDAHDRDAIAQLLTSSGMAMINAGFADDVASALTLLTEFQGFDSSLRRALLGVIATSRGQYAEGEAQLDRAIETIDRTELQADLILRLALLRLNRGEDVRSLLELVLSNN
ncbi:MAG TPA: AAA family ATPase, partial [Candidatus Aquilonibacter sp.]|nr:AAA family ATPase [Candidatus Aquilonibacter sp.]